MDIIIEYHDGYLYSKVVNPSINKLNYILEKMNPITNREVTYNGDKFRLDVNIDESGKHYLLRFRDKVKRNDYSQYWLNENVEKVEEYSVELIAPNGEGFDACLHQVHEKHDAFPCFIDIVMTGQLPADTIWDEYYY